MDRKIILILAATIAVTVPGCKADRASQAVSIQSRSGFGAASDCSSAACLPEGSTNVAVLKCPAGKGLTDEERTAASLTKVTGTDNLYLMTYYGDYSDLVKKENDAKAGGTGQTVSAGCTLLSMTGEKSRPIYGRNFDNPQGTKALLTFYQPKNKYSSIAFSRLSDLVLLNDSDLKGLNDTQEKGLMAAPFYTTGGMNEKGLAVSLAYNPPGVSTKGFKGKSIFITNLMRTILDNASDVDEAIRICKASKAFDFGIDTLSHHFLIADASANSTIAEFSDGSWQFLRNDTPFQVVTNFPLYHVPEEQRKNACQRYQTASNLLEKIKGKGDWRDMLNILESVKQSYSQAQTIWSYAADLKAGSIYLCMNGDFTKVYKASFR